MSILGKTVGPQWTEWSQCATDTKTRTKRFEMDQCAEQDCESVIEDCVPQGECFVNGHVSALNYAFIFPSMVFMVKMFK